MAGWEDKFNKLVEINQPIDDKKEWRFALEEHKNKGTLHINVRIFNTAGNYIGPTKNGINFTVNSVQELENFQVTLNQFLSKVKEML